MTQTNTTSTGVPGDDLVTRIEADWSDASAWDDDPEPRDHRAPRLGASITLRLPPKLADEIRSIANAQDIAYTAMIRDWIEDRVTETHDLQHTLVFLASGSLLEEPPSTNLSWDSQEEDTRAAL